ncbi:metal ABC transporter ATP-binding protein [Gottfriedia acidiceleris]|uniref:metal ABC transporter ATP-binding protein n=1 Tax=Bacillaceae TaxID=186817 RepID=UPI000BEE62DE|nr:MULTISPECIES: metal ABC transporter ATP-binding protein [unclassified Bacillus (in: firmicutes)]PEC50237.1 zinc ABC transporter ATP-binding protein [Bacillus sp. AFS096315]PFM77783.1 zinc ABC transporter ATP-binding protein [Bacillus sp. AFS077874]
MSLIQLKNVKFGYNHTSVIDNVSFEVNRGEFIGITGQNGASKSTLLKLMLGLLKPWSGDVQIKKDANNELIKIGYVPQQIASFNVGFPSTVIELVKSGRFNQKKWYEKMNKIDHEIIKNALVMVGMWEYRHHKIGSLSGGQKQKICIARVLASEPNLLVLDEPTTGMDKESRENFYQFLGHQVKRHNRTVVMVTHEKEEVEQYLDKIIHLEKGEHGLWRCLTLNSCNGHFGLVD